MTDVRFLLWYAIHPMVRTKTMGEKLLLTVPEAADLLGMSARRLYALIAQHMLPDSVVIRLGRSIKVSGPRLMHWLGADDAAGSTRPPIQNDRDPQTPSQTLTNAGRVLHGVRR